MLLAEMNAQKNNVRKSIDLKVQHKYRRCCCLTAGPSGQNRLFVGLIILDLALVGGVFGLVILDPTTPTNYFYGYIMGGIILL